jgi:hypothetical protein
METFFILSGGAGLYVLDVSCYIGPKINSGIAI